jgi:nucleoside 2-deoxyribosyltransferase
VAPEHATGLYCGDEQPAAIGCVAQFPDMELVMASVYLAGPAVFFHDAKEQALRMRAACHAVGLDPLWPADNLKRETLAQATPEQVAEAIYRANLALMQQCDAVLADIRPFRGPGLDAGTAFEIGYAVALGKPVVAWTMDSRDYAARVIAGLERDQRRTGRNARGAHDDHDMHIEDFGLCDNLMIARGVIGPLASFDRALAKVAQVVKS